MTHDCTAARDGRGIELIVRPKNTYGKAKSGEHVIVDEEELDNPSTRSACMTPDEAQNLAVKLEATRAAIEEKKNKRTIKAMVEAGLDRLTESIKAATVKADDEAVELDHKILGGEDEE